MTGTTRTKTLKNDRRWRHGNRGHCAIGIRRLHQSERTAGARHQSGMKDDVSTQPHAFARQAASGRRGRSATACAGPRLRAASTSAKAESSRLLLIYTTRDGKNGKGPPAEGHRREDLSGDDASTRPRSAGQPRRGGPHRTIYADRPRPRHADTGAAAVPAGNRLR